MTIRGMDMVLKLWESEAPYELKDEFWEIKVQNPRPDFNMGDILKPYQKPHPPIATSIIKAESRGALTAGERGYIPISANMVTPQVLKRQWRSTAKARPRPAARSRTAPTGGCRAASWSRHRRRRLGIRPAPTAPTPVPMST